MKGVRDGEDTSALPTRVPGRGGRAGAEQLTTAEREELRRLRREVKTLQQERDILRKAAAYFAKETL